MTRIYAADMTCVTFEMKLLERNRYGAAHFEMYYYAFVLRAARYLFNQRKKGLYHKNVMCIICVAFREENANKNKKCEFRRRKDYAKRTTQVQN